jgi:hypothetical protein
MKVIILLTNYNNLKDDKSEAKISGSSRGTKNFAILSSLFGWPLRIPGQ